jgi:uncharacterized protein (DUF1697 family)
MTPSLMPRYVAFLRGVSPMNAKMAELKRAFEEAGFTNVRTVLSSGNVAFDAPRASESSLQHRAEEAMEEGLGHSFRTIVRSTAALEKLLASDPFENTDLPAGARRVITFVRNRDAPSVEIPPAFGGAEVVAIQGREVFTAYVPGDKGPAFMRLIEKAFGKEVTTRTWESVQKCAAA